MAHPEPADMVSVPGGSCQVERQNFAHIRVIDGIASGWVCGADGCDAVAVTVTRHATGVRWSIG